MSQKRLQAILKNIKTERRGGAPHEGWVRQNRDILLMQVRNTTDSASRKTSALHAVRHFFAVFVPTENLAMAARAVGVFLLVMGTVLGGGLVSAQVYRDAAPGEMLYGMKLAVEKVQLVLSPNDEYKTRLHTEFADRRLDEVVDLAEGPADRHHLAVGVLAAFERELLALQDGFEALREDDPAGVVDVAKLLERKMAAYQNMLRKASATLPPQLHRSIARARNLVDGMTVRALAVIVEKHLQGDAAAPGAVVASKFEERLRQAETKLDAVASEPKAAETAGRAKSAIAEAKAFIKEENYQAALSKIVEVAELTQEAEEEAEAEEATEPPAEEPAEPAAEPEDPVTPETEGGGDTSTTEESPPPASP